MAEPPAEFDAPLTPKDLAQWLTQELRDLSRALELRVKEATELVTAYALGELTPEEAEERMARYEHRWGEALYGITTTEDMTNEHIRRRIDEEAGDFTPPRVWRDIYRQKFGTSPRSSR